MIIDPLDENLAIVDGQLAHGIRLGPVGTPPEELMKAPIVAYGSIQYSSTEGEQT